MTKVVDSTWHAELSSYRKHQALYEIRKFNDGFAVFFCATPFRHGIGEGIPTLEAAQKIAADDWQRFIGAALAPASHIARRARGRSETLDEHS